MKSIIVWTTKVSFRVARLLPAEITDYLNPLFGGYCIRYTDQAIDSQLKEGIMLIVNIGCNGF